MINKFDDRKKVIDIIKKIRNNPNDKQNIKKDISLIECPSCKENFSFHELRNNLFCCYKCKYHYKMPINERLNMLFDNYKPLEKKPSYKNPINFPEYTDKLKQLKKTTNYNEAVSWGIGKIQNYKIVYFILNPHFLMGSMGTYVGEQITLAIEYATKKKLPLLGISASGGARMQEGIFSLMQMSKTLGALNKFIENNLYISLLTNPTTGGVTASFALIGDINIAEPNALIGFAGPRVIKETIGEELPDNFQKSEFLEEKGFIDFIAERKNQKNVLIKLLKLHSIRRFN